MSAADTTKRDLIHIGLPEHVADDLANRAAQIRVIDAELDLMRTVRDYREDKGHTWDAADAQRIINELLVRRRALDTGMASS